MTKFLSLYPFLRSGSVICDAELIISPDSENRIILILNNISSSGVVGNLSIVPGSLIVTEVQGTVGILSKCHYEGEANSWVVLNSSG